jgi:hypothetical protein
MSVGSNLQEMENVVTKGAAQAEPMQKLSTGIAPGQTGSWEDLGGPTPDTYRPDDDSAKLKDPAATLAQVKDVVNAKAAKADAMKKMAEETEEDEEDLIAEEEVTEAMEEEDAEEEDAPKKKKKGGKEEAEDEDEDEMKKEEYNIEEDVNALLSGEELSEEFQEKARTIFETAIKSKVAEIKEDLQAAYEVALVEEVQEIKAELVERVDAYLEYAADEWVAENALAIEHGLKTEMTESFLQGMRGLFEDHYVTIPEERYDVIESMVDKLDEMETKLNEQIEKNVALNRRLAESVTDVVFAEVSEGLALSQKDKLASLAENVEFDGEDNYREKLANLRESYFPSKATSAQRTVSENLSEEVDYSNNPVVEGVMGRYLQTLQRVSKK